MMPSSSAINCPFTCWAVSMTSEWCSGSGNTPAAALVMQEIPSTSRPMCLATIASGAVDNGLEAIQGSQFKLQRFATLGGGRSLRDVSSQTSFGGHNRGDSGGKPVLHEHPKRLGARDGYLTQLGDALANQFSIRL